MLNKTSIATIIGAAAIGLLKDSAHGSGAQDGVYRPRNYSGFENTAKSKAKAKKYTAISFDKWGEEDYHHGEYNPFKLPPSLENFVNVETIEFNHFNIPILTLPDFSIMPKLKKVVITSTYIGADKLLKNMKREKVTERSQKIFQKRFLEAIFACTNLEILHIKPNYTNGSDRGFLIDLPDSIGNLVNLVRLSMNDMRLSSIPNSIGNLIQLKILDLSENKLSSLPSSIANLTKISVINLSGNLFKDLPHTFSSIGTQSAGLTVNLSWNPFESIPLILGQTKMKKLDFIGNMKDSFPALAIYSSWGWHRNKESRYDGGFEIKFNDEGEGEISFINDNWYRGSFERLDWTNPMSYPNFSGVVRGFSALQIFNIKEITIGYFNLNLSPTFFNTLRNMNIRKVILHKCWIRDVINLPDSIEDLYFDSCFGFSINDDFWKKISHLENLRSLKINDPEKRKDNNYSISSDILKLKSLRYLDIPTRIRVNDEYRDDTFDYLVSPSKPELISWLRSGRINGNVAFAISEHIKDETQSQLRRF